MLMNILNNKYYDGSNTEMKEGMKEEYEKEINKYKEEREKR